MVNMSEKADPAETTSFDPYAPGADERYEAMARVRAAGGVARTPSGWYVATAEGVRAGLFDVERFVGSFVDTSSMHPDDVILSAIPEPRHGRIRKIVNGAIAGHRTAQAEPFIREQARVLVDHAVAVARSAGCVDLIGEAAGPLPAIVIAHMLGVPVEDQDRFRVWSNELLAEQGTANNAGMADLHPEFGAYIQALIDARRAASDPPDDIVTRMMDTEVEGERLSDRMIRTQTMFLIVAGNETTQNLIGNCLQRLATMPGLYARVRADRRLLGNLMEESLRFDSPAQVLGRAVLADTKIEGCPMHKGDRVVFGIASANRDERAFEHPDEFRVDRARPRDHLAFGTGPHICPGAALARLETMAFLESFCARVAAFALAPDALPEPNPVFWAQGYRSLVVTLDPAG
jgi:cytochrome P450